MRGPPTPKGCFPFDGSWTLPRLALYQPDIPQNAGAILRLSACLSFGVDVIAPCGFVWDDRKMRRAGMDYLDRADLVHHSSWQGFDAWRRSAGRRLVLLTTQGAAPLNRFAFQADDVIMVGRETAGVPDAVAAACDARIRIPMTGGVRSLNVAQAASIAMWEALRGLEMLP